MSERSVRWFLDQLVEAHVADMDAESGRYLFQDREVDHFTMEKWVREAGEACQS